MTVKKQFAQDGADLEVRMDQLVVVLAQMLDEPAAADRPAKTSPNADLRSVDDRDIHVIENNPRK